MATTSKRANFRPRALECFRNQVYPAGWTVDLLIDDHETDSLGKKLNRMVASSTAEYLLVHDDDDWYSPTRIARQIQPMLDDPNILVTGTSRIYYWNIETKQAYQYIGKPDRWLGGVAANAQGKWERGTPSLWLGGIAFRRSFWETHPFEDTTIGVDTRWMKPIPPAQRFDVCDPALFIATIHANNTCKKNPSNWAKADYANLQQLMKQE